MSSAVIAIILVQGVANKPDCGSAVFLISDIIKDVIGAPCSVLVAAHDANGKLFESRIGCRDPEQGKVLKDLFHFDHFQTTLFTDATGLEVYGALKEVYDFGVRIIEALGVGGNSIAEVMRRAAEEMIGIGRLITSDHSFNENTINSLTEKDIHNMLKDKN